MRAVAKQTGRCLAEFSWPATASFQSSLYNTRRAIHTAGCPLCCICTNSPSNLLILGCLPATSNPWASRAINVWRSAQETDAVTHTPAHTTNCTVHPRVFLPSSAIKFQSGANRHHPGGGQRDGPRAPARQPPGLQHRASGSGRSPDLSPAHIITCTKSSLRRTGRVITGHALATACQASASPTSSQPNLDGPDPFPQLRTPVRHPLNNQQISHLRLVTIHGPLGGQRTQVSPWHPACPPVHFAPRPGRAGRRERSSDVTTRTGAELQALRCPKSPRENGVLDKNRGETYGEAFHPSPACVSITPSLPPAFAAARRRCFHYPQIT